MNALLSKFKRFMRLSSSTEAPVTQEHVNDVEDDNEAMASNAVEENKPSFVKDTSNKTDEAESLLRRKEELLDRLRTVRKN